MIFIPVFHYPNRHLNQEIGENHQWNITPGMQEVHERCVPHKIYHYFKFEKLQYNTQNGSGRTHRLLEMDYWKRIKLAQDFGREKPSAKRRRFPLSLIIKSYHINFITILRSRSFGRTPKIEQAEHMDYWR